MQRQKPSKDIVWKSKNFPIVVLAENIHSPSNVGLIMRGCEIFGVNELYFIGPYSNTDTYKFKKSARSAEQFLNVQKSINSLEVIQRLRDEGYKIVAVEIAERSKSIVNYKITKESKYALIVGSERHGIDAQTLKHADDAIHIEQYGKIGSLNVAMALNISLFHFTNQFS